MKEYPCTISQTKKCKHGGTKVWNYGFATGTSSYCYLIHKWISDLDGKCSLNKHLTQHALDLKPPPAKSDL